MTLRFAALLILLSASCWPYSHFLHFPNRATPLRGIPEKFDLNALPNKTLSYFVSDQTGLQLHTNDSYAGLISQIRAAAEVWNGVDTSELRLAFGGLITSGTPQNAPTLEALFEEVPPGLVAAGGPTVRASSNGTFVPILKSVVIIRPDLTQRASYSESFFGTLVHEIGHALGLQHTLTSGVMSTAVTRATTKAKPITQDDVAGLSLLYPAKNFATLTGSISGRVTMNGSGVNLASVVAISPNGAAVSTLSNPDGTYRIDGLPSRSYLVYVHPLPPPRPGQATNADVVYPLDADGRSLGPGAPFETIFFPGSTDTQRATPLSVNPGSVIENVNFTVRQKTGFGIHSVETYTFPANFAVKPAYLNASSQRPFLVITGSGLIQGNGPVSGLGVSILGGSSLSIRPYASAPSTYLQVDFDVRDLTFFADNPRHLIFSLNGDIYVLPSGFYHAERQPPSITSLVPAMDNGNRIAIVTGSNLNWDTRILFDGVTAQTRSYDETTGRLTVAVPPAPNGHRANVVALNTDGQSSLFVQNEAPPSFAFGSDTALASSATFLIPNPSIVTAGSETMIQIEGVNTNFAQGVTVVGFGSSDVVVRRMWVVNPNRVLVNIAVSPAAQAGTTHLTVASGLQLHSQPFGLNVQPSSSAAFWITAPEAEVFTPGSTVSVTVGNSPVALSTSNVVALLNENRIVVTGVNGNQVTFVLPSGTPVGPAVLRLESGSLRSAPIAFAVEPPAPRILTAATGDQILSGSRPLRGGEVLSLTVANLEQSGSSVSASQLSVDIGGLELRVMQVVEQAGTHKLSLLVPQHVPTGPQVPLKVIFDKRTSEPINVFITN